MTTNIIAFPTDRCRQPLSAIEAAERADYELAAERCAREPGHGPSIKTMIGLALEGRAAGPRADAAAWLRAECNVTVSVA